MKKIALVSCTKLKKQVPCCARDMYLPSTLYRKASTYIEGKYDFWYILSAKHGFLELETEIAPYDVTLNRMNIADRKEWSRGVAEKIIGKFNPNEFEIYFYAGEKYRRHLIPLLEKEGFKCYIPLAGMKIGEQLCYYKNRECQEEAVNC